MVFFSVFLPIQIPWSYPTARPSFAESWRFRLRQILQDGKEGDRNDEANGVKMATFALHLRMLWHCLRWDEIVVSAATSDDAALDAHGRICFKQLLAESHGGGYTMRRVVAIQPLVSRLSFYPEFYSSAIRSASGVLRGAWLGSLRG